MSAIRRFEDIEAWKKARELSHLVYALTKQREFAADPDLRRQLRRAAVSVMANIAEGFERGGNAEFIQFLSTAKGSAGEIESHLFVALDEGYVCSEQFESLRNHAQSTKNLIAGFIHYLRGTEKRGLKHVRARSNSEPRTPNPEPCL